MTVAELDAKVIAEASGTHAVIGLTSKCPYGLGACWGGAFDALVKLDGVSAVRPIANTEDSTADVYLHGDTLPVIDHWQAQLQQSANGSYDLRGVELAVATDNFDCICSGLACVGFGHMQSRQLPEAAKDFQDAIQQTFLATLTRYPSEREMALVMQRRSGPRYQWLSDLQWALLNKLDFTFNY